MRRLLGIGAIALLTACGTGDAVRSTQARARVKSIAAAREQVALRKAGSLLRRIPLPPGAVRVAHPPANQYLRDSWVGGSVITMFADRRSFWRVHGSMASVVRFAERHPVPGLTSDGGGGGARGKAESVQFYGRFHRPLQRMASVAAVNVGGSTYVRVDAAAAWNYPRSPREVLPAGVREVDINGGGISRHVVNASDVARIVGWFGQLSVTPPGANVICAPDASAHVTFIFRSVSRAGVARAVVPSGGGDGCEPVSFTIGGKAQTPLVDTTVLPFAQRVERLFRVCFGAGPGHGQLSPSCNKTWAGQVAKKFLHRFRLPPGAQRLAHEPHGDGGLLRSPALVSGGAELVDQHRFWRVRSSLASAEAFVKTHQRFTRQTGSSTASGPGVPANHTVTLDYFNFAPHGLISSRQIEVTFVSLPGGWTGIRADAQIVWIYPRTEAQFPPGNTRVIEVRSGSISRRTTDYQTINRIIYRFSRLKLVQPGTAYHCPAMLFHEPKVTIEFHGVNPTVLARAVAHGTGTPTACDPIVFSVHGRTALLVGGNFVRWLEGVLGVRFR